MRVFAMVEIRIVWGALKGTMAKCEPAEPAEPYHSQAPWESAPRENRGRPGKTGENRWTNSTPPMGEKCRKMDENACTGRAPKHLKDRELSAKAQLASRKHQATAAGSGQRKTR
jgi:hypothetical protein